MTALRAITGLAGLVFLLAGLAAFVRLRSRRFLALSGIGIGGALVLLAVHPNMMEVVGPSTYVMRIRLALGALSLLVLLITLETVRRRAMRENYALLWIGTGLVIFLFTVYPEAVAWLVALTGMHYVSAVVVFIFAFLVLVAFHFSIAMSEFREDQKRIAQHTGLLELRIAQLEQKIAEARQGRDEPDQRGAAARFQVSGVGKD